MNAADSILMNMLAAAQAAASNIQGAKPSGSGQKDGPSFQDLLQDKKQAQAAQPADKADAKPADGTAEQQPEEELKLPGTEQQALAAAMMAQNIVIVPDAQPTAEAAVVLVQTAEQILPQAAPQTQHNLAQAAQQTAPQAQAEAAPTAAMQTAEIPKETAKPEQNAVQSQADAEIQPQAETVQRTQTAERQEGNGDHPTELPKKNAEGMEVTIAGESQAQPLFRQVESAPVKVGDAQTLDTQAPDMDKKLSAKLNQALDEGARRIEIRLTPENLGTVVVEMTQSSDGALHVVLRASGDKAMNLLSEHAANLGSLLQSGTQGTVQVEVQRQQESQQSQQQRNQDNQQQGGNHPQDQQQEHRQRHDTAQDFLQQLRLGLIPLET